MQTIIIIYLAIVNLLAFALMGKDKQLARQGKWRISERNLFLPAILFGAWGGVAGMQVFRHKTKHLKFVWGFPALAIFQTILLVMGWRFFLA